MKRLLALVAVFIFTLSPLSQAGVLIEPLVGYNFSSRLNIQDPTYKNEYKGNGGALGGRFGYQNFGFQIGVDYLRSSIDFDKKDLTKNVALEEWAGFIGFEFPILLRVYAGYIFSATGSSKFDISSTNTPDIKTITFESGSGMKAGIGFTPLPFLAVNFEYRRGSFDEYKIDQTTYDDGSDYSSYLVSLSLPLDL